MYNQNDVLFQWERCVVRNMHAMKRRSHKACFCYIQGDVLKECDELE